MTLADIEPSDLRVLARTLGRWHCTDRWALWGQTPSPEMWSQLLWHNVPLQQALRSDEGTCVGLVQLAAPDLDDGVAHLELVLDPAVGDGLDRDVRAFVDRTFRDYPLRKLCFAAAADDLDLPPCLATVARGVGCLTEHRRRDRDDYVDLNLFEVWAGDWAGGATDAA